MKKYICRVCGKKFDDLLIHLHKNEEELLKHRPKALALRKDDIKPDHLKEFDRIEKSISWLTGGEELCFCGGDIISHTYGNDEYFSVEVVCDKCGFIWDED